MRYTQMRAHTCTHTNTHTHTHTPPKEGGHTISNDLHYSPFLPPLINIKKKCDTYK